VFFSTTIVYSSDTSTCNTQLNDQKSKSSSQEEKIKTLTGEKEQLQKNLDDEKRKSSSLQTQVDSLKKDITDLNKKIADKDSEITTLKGKVSELESKISNLESEVNRLRSEIQQKDGEINNLKHELSVKEAEIVKLKKDIYYYQLACIGSAVVHVGVIIEDVIAHISLSRETKRAAEFENENRNLKGELNTTQHKVKEQESQIAALNEQINQVQKQHDLCKSTLIIEIEKNDALNRTNHQLKGQLEAYPSLAVEQAKLQILKKVTGYNIEATELYNARKEGYDPVRFNALIGTAKPTIVVVRTSTGYVFGGSINITWGNSGGLHRDDNAFTFSTTHNHICKVQIAEKAINFGSNYFIEFGDPEFYIARSDSFTTTGYAESDHEYACNAREKGSFYSDSNSFTVEDLFAYRVDITPGNPQQ